MEITILTGLSGSGKSMAAQHLEDMGFFCIDNMPPQLVADLTRVLAGSEGTSENDDNRKPVSRIALVMDTRNPNFVKDLLPVLQELKDLKINVRVLFLEASDAALISRYKQTRREHPLSGYRGGLSLSQAIRAERDFLTPVREIATDIIDTGNYSTNQLRDYLRDLFGEGIADSEFVIFVQSFGFKYGIPQDADLVLDVRFVPNPFYIEKLKSLSGKDEPVIEYIEQFPETKTFIEMQSVFLKFVMPYYIREGKARLNLSIGCTGGRHRSVMIADRLTTFLKSLNYHVITTHRDIRRDQRKRQIEKWEEETTP
ncbi:MAG: RNase adapter RapZ [Clostridiaceae bacterium]|nr:RNase adapter RapZ [Clostridiaceae bacterium]